MVRRLLLIAKFKKGSKFSILAVLAILSLGLICLTNAQPERGAQTPRDPAPAPTVIKTSNSGAGKAAAGSDLNYGGKSAEQWLNQINFRRNDRAFDEAERAFIEMGPSALPFLRAKLASPKVQAESKNTTETRRKAAWLLKDLGPVAEPAVPDLIAALEDEEHVVSSYAALALGEIGPGAKPAVSALFDSLARGNGPAAKALVRIDPNNPQLVPKLIEALKTPNTEPRTAARQAPQSAAMALQALGPKAKDAVPALREALPSPLAAVALLSIAWDHPEVVAEAKAALRVKSQPPPLSPDPPPLSPDLDKHIEGYIKAGEQLGLQTALDTIADVLRRAKSQGAAVSDSLIQDRILPIIAKALDDPQPRVSSAACAVLGGLGPAGRPLLPKVIALLERDESYQRANALAAISRVAPGDQALLPTLIQLLKDWHQGVRANACSCLTHYGSEATRAVPALHECLKDPYLWVRFNATVALWGIGREAPDIAVLQDALRENPADDYVAQRILEMLSGSNQPSVATISILRQLAQIGDPEVSTRAKTLLKTLSEDGSSHEASLPNEAPGNPLRAGGAHVQKRDVLQKEITIHLDNVPLKTILLNIANLTAVNIRMDEPLSVLSKPVSINMDQVKLRDVFRWLSRNYDLQFQIADDSIWVVDAKGPEQTRYYPLPREALGGSQQPSEGSIERAIADKFIGGFFIDYTNSMLIARGTPEQLGQMDSIIHEALAVIAKERDQPGSGNTSEAPGRPSNKVSSDARDQATLAARRAANEEAQALYNCHPFVGGPSALWTNRHWVWQDRRGVGHSDIEAIIWLTPDLSTQKVHVLLYDNRR